MPSAADREKALETALAQIDRQFGKGSVMRLGSDERAPVEVIPTGSIALDVALGIGGLPRGRIVEIYGPESSGKTTLTLHAIANAQRAGGIAAFVDAEHALDPDYAKALGVDIDALLVSQPDTGEQALEIADMLGQVIYKDNVMAHGGNLNEKIQLSSTIANGMYLLTLRSGATSNVFHIVIEQ